MYRSRILQKFTFLTAVIFTVVMSLLVGQVYAGKQYTLDNQWEKAKERLSLLESWSNPYTFLQLEQVDIQKGWRCLDAGAGLGSVSRWLADKVGPEGLVDALDMDTKFLEEINKPTVHVLKKNLVTDTLPEKKYDFIFVRDVLMHVPEREQVLTSLVGALKPGGVLMVEDLGLLPSGVSFQNFSSDSEMNAYVQNLFDSLEEHNRISFHSGYRNARLFEESGLEGVNAHAYSPLARGNDIEGQLLALTLMQLKPLLMKYGLNEKKYDQVTNRFENIDARWWGFVRITTTGRKPS
ncbi:class I SAM-dependent methyltransferase [Parendozoicomonas sp. Alg238-R29]|uniref:class I SAM-dependent methyltransferase n=1 Tax=Parendozoicomonas sp. Alg238-R29 TaxID=2993446 RepID=UPI00248D532D|nr:class I SAM-dependent methyltransferase [Parendozoicomonas sp. Alg238-R29]